MIYPGPLRAKLSNVCLINLNTSQINTLSDESVRPSSSSFPPAKVKPRWSGTMRTVQPCLELLAREDQALLVRRDALTHLRVGFDMLQAQSAENCSIL